MPKWSEYFKLDSSKLIRRWAVANASRRKINCPLIGRGHGHVTRFLKKVKTPPISERVKTRHLKFCTLVDRSKYYSEREINVP